MSSLKETYFRDEAAAYEFVESFIWPDGPVCPHCHNSGKIKKLEGASTRIGTYKCYHCRRPFTVKIGTVFEASRLPMHVWLQSIFLISQFDGLVEKNEFAQALGVSPKTASEIACRLYKAMHTASEAHVVKNEARGKDVSFLELQNRRMHRSAVRTYQSVTRGDAPSPGSRWSQS